AFQFVKKAAFKEINHRKKLRKPSAGVLLRKQQNKMKSVLLPANAHSQAPNVRAQPVRCRGRMFDQNP
ncbi:MAG: hypothetical protein LUF80_03125, partial [Oscillospiraceae bacterium]|nr:hypothetical protein [Oscillospiraceae bacterium]